jgi:hypothetical protein
MTVGPNFEISIECTNLGILPSKLPALSAGGGDRS